ncbi:integrase core domain-containing protein [Streptomyces xanthophaeus]|uniref:integrase core domain-containing protein n=1 Tax=Streptomyces xanthophaeus TaxID=67385 RepID=UPI00369A1203
MVHRNAPLTETGRLRLARCVVEDGWPVRRAAERFQVSHTTAARWAGRYRALGIAGMGDRSSRPHHQPQRTAVEVESEVLRLRREHRIGPLRLAVRCHIAASTAPTCAGFLARATAWFAAMGITVERVLTDNAWAYSKNTWRNTCRELGTQPRWTRPWRPQTNGKAERFHRTLLEEWAYHRPYTSDRERMEAFTDWLHWYNYHRPHTGIQGHTPASRGTNLSGQHT